MRKLICVLLGIMLLSCSSAGCKKETVFVVPEGKVIVSVPDNFRISAAVGSDTECEKITTAIKGIKRKDFYDYYCVTVDSPIEIARDFGWFDYAGYGNYGKGKVVSGFDLGEEKLTLKLYEDVPITFILSENCDIVPVYENFTAIGMLLTEYNEDHKEDTGTINYLYEAKNFFNEDGSVKEVEGLYYLLLKDKFGDMQYDYNTNLTVKGFACTERDNHIVNAKFTVDSIADKITICSVCRYESGGYFISNVTIDLTNSYGFTVSVDEGELTVEFTAA